MRDIFSNSDSRHVSLLEDGLISLDMYTKQLAAALQLFDFSVSRRKSMQHDQEAELYRDWQFLAARDGAMSIRHFGQAMIATQDTLHKCGSVQDKVDRKKIGNANKLFNDSFPGIHKIRHAIGHSAELAANAGWKSKHSAAGPVELPELGMNIAASSRMLFNENLYARRFIATFDGKIHNYELSLQSLQTLAEVRDQYYHAFQRLISG